MSLTNNHNPQPPPMSPEFAKILAAAAELFMKYGTRSVSMADISKHLGMSKKTLYTHITNKDDLILAFVDGYLQKEQTEVAEIIKNAKNALDELIQIMRNVQRTMQNMNPCLLLDFLKYHREGWKMIQEFRQDFVYHHVYHNLQRGVAEGIYRAELNTAIISKIYVQALPIFADPAEFQLHNYSLVELHTEYIKYHIHGILSTEGLKLLADYSFA
jgi:AcrR family transcriptional regulator